MNKKWPYGKKYHRTTNRGDKITPHLGVKPIKSKRKGGKTVGDFKDLLRDSSLVQGGITLGLVGTACYLWATGQSVPSELWTAISIVLGFFFGSKTQQILNRRVR